MECLRIDFSYSGIQWINGNAEKLPFADETFDVYTIAFGIRNVTHVDKVLFCNIFLASFSTDFFSGVRRSLQSFEERREVFVP